MKKVRKSTDLYCKFLFFYTFKMEKHAEIWAIFEDKKSRKSYLSLSDDRLHFEE